MTPEYEVLQWIDVDSRYPESGAPGKMLMLRLAMSLNDGETAGSDGPVTQSVELALSEYERGTLVRLLRSLIGKGLIEIFGQDGTVLDREQLSSRDVESYEIALSPIGREHLTTKGSL
jgi:hypothetical protein